MADDTKKNDKIEFGTATKVYDVTKSLQDVEDRRAQDRAKINSLMNGQRPYTKEEEKKHQIQINVNWGQGKRIMLDANRQLNNALLHPGILFNCTLETGLVEKRDEWSQKFTKNIHKPLQRDSSGRLNHFLIRSRNASVCMHGIGVLLWKNSWSWMPRFVPLEDFLVPTDSYCDFSNWRYFAVNLYFTPGELVDMTQGDKVDKRWNQKMIKQILDAHREYYSESTPSTWRNQPEAMKQVHDQNKGYYYSDAIPKIRMRAFYYQQVDEPNKWYRSIILRETNGDAKTDEFLYDGSDEPFADSISHIINVQYGDANIVAPLKLHSVRGLGVDLYAPVETLNRLQCELAQHTFEQLKMYFKIQDPADRDRLKQVLVQQYGFIPEGLTIVPQTERHQVDSGLVVTVMDQMRQVMQENSSSYVNDTDKGDGQAMTAKEAQIRLNQASVMVTGMLQMMYVQEAFYYQELVRRFCNESSRDPEVKQFRQDCIDDGIPPELLVAKNWNVTPERVLGGGDRSLAQQESQWLLQNRSLYDPNAQQKILRIATRTMLDDPAKANMLVPAAPVLATQGTYVAEQLFGTMMHGIQPAIRDGIDQIGYIEALLKMMGTVIQQITSTDNVGTQGDLVGLATVAQNIGQHMAILAGDEQQRQRVKKYGDMLGQLINLVKGFAQRQAAKREESQPDPKAQASAKGMLMKAEMAAQIKQRQSEAKMRERELEFQLDQARENAALLAEIKREDLSHRQDVMNSSFDAALKTLQAMRGMQKE
jgi:hypothetical protein